MQHMKSQNFLFFLMGILSIALFASLGLLLVLNIRTLYYFDIHALNISETSGLTETVIRMNYDALMDYCSPFYQGMLILPTLPSSPQGLQHFAEVKEIFVAFYWIFAISLLLFGWCASWIYRKKEYRGFKISALTTLILPIFVGLAVSANFDSVFLLFHKLCFRNDYWIFYPDKDPIINLLPSEYFLHCALVIVFTLLLGGLLQYLFYRFATARLSNGQNCCTTGQYHQTSKYDEADSKM